MTIENEILNNNGQKAPGQGIATSKKVESVISPEKAEEIVLNL